MINYDYKQSLKEYLLVLRKCKAGRHENIDGEIIVYSLDDDSVTMSILSDMYLQYYTVIHDILSKYRTSEAEKEIREHIKNIISDVIPSVDGRIKVWEKRARRKQLDENGKETLKKYYKLQDDFYSLAAFRSLKYFALYSEFDKDDSSKIWKNVMPLFDAFFSYGNSMVLDGNIKRITKSYPTGYGKSYSDLIMISYIFGQDIENDVMKVVGNNKLIVDVTTGLTRIMCSKWYAKVFPFFQQFDCDKEKMFDICKANEGVMLIHGCSRPKSFLVVAKDTAVDGGRFKFRFYDDITRSMDKENVIRHEKDWSMYNDQWVKREYDSYNSYEIASGTRYHVEDFLSRYRENYGEKDAIEDKRFKYTKYNARTRFVIITVPKLDYETDESTYPQKYSTEDARIERDRDIRSFNAMQQQIPEAPEKSPFYWDNIKTYRELPFRKSEGGNMEDYCRASLDLPRTGSNNLSMPIFRKCGDYEYLVDVFYANKPLDFVVQGKTELEWLCEFLISHNVIELVVENNTCSNIANQISEKLIKMGYTSCIVKEVYTTEHKETKIMSCWATIVNCIYFPERKMYAPSSMVGKFMYDLTSWSVDSKTDDAIDSVCMFVKQFLKSNSGSFAVFSTFSR